MIRSFQGIWEGRTLKSWIAIQNIYYHFRRVKSRQSNGIVWIEYQISLISISISRWKENNSRKVVVEVYSQINCWTWLIMTSKPTIPLFLKIISYYCKEMMIKTKITNSILLITINNLIMVLILSPILMAIFNIAISITNPMILTINILSLEFKFLKTSLKETNCLQVQLPKMKIFTRWTSSGNSICIHNQTSNKY